MLFRLPGLFTLNYSNRCFKPSTWAGQSSWQLTGALREKSLTYVPSYQGVQVLEFLNLLYTEEKIITDYGMSDPRYHNSYNEVSATFCVRTFKNLMPLIIEVLDKMRTDIYVEKNVCLSHGSRIVMLGPIDLFKFVNQVIDLYKFCPQKEILNNMMSLAFKLVSSFQAEFKIMVEESADMELDNFCALTNSNIKFISCMRQFLEATKDMSGVPVESLQKSFQFNFLMKTFAEISNGSYLRIQDLVKAKITEGFMAIQDYKKVVIVDNPHPA